MKLVELLARELDEWTAGQVAAVQDPDADGTVWFVSSNAGLEFNGSEWKYDGYFEIAISRPSNRAEDYDSAIVTRAQWQAERDRQKGGEWKRHRGGVQPIEDGVSIEVRHRDGEIVATEAGSKGAIRWKHTGQPGDIMAFRIISQPQAEEVEVITVDPVVAANVEAFNDQWQIDRVDGPLVWRDTVNELDAYIEKFTRERDALINRLALEGFALIPAMTPVMGGC